MADAPTDLIAPDKTLTERYVPLEQRESQNIGPKPYIIDWATVLGLTALGMLVGHTAGKLLAPKNIKLGAMTKWMYGTDRLDGVSGTGIGGKIGGIYGLYRKWHKTEGKHIGVENISKDLKTVLDPAQLEKETKKEEAIVDGLTKLQEAQARYLSHRTALLTRRNADGQEMEIGS